MWQILKDHVLRGDLISGVKIDHRLGYTYLLIHTKVLLAQFFALFGGLFICLTSKITAWDQSTDGGLKQYV
jgi:hypothetical protein